MVETVEVLHPGILTLLQDEGRSTGRRYGIGPGGALDRYAHRAANRLVANSASAATLEIMLHGLALRFEEAALIAVTGAKFDLTLDGQARPDWMSLFVRAGQVLEIGRRWHGARTYLAVHGGWDAPLVLGSRSTDLKAGLGGYRGLGRALQAGDQLAIGPRSLPHLASAAGRAWQDSQRPAYSQAVTVRVIPGPFEDWFDSSAFDRLYSQAYTVTPASDRMGMRLSASLPLPRRFQQEMTPYGAVWGNLQVPPDGQPIILQADHQVTGGYPVIATVVSQDLPLLAQILPGDTVRFIPAKI